MSVRKLTCPYKPRPWAIPFHKTTKRWMVLVVHRRAGKTTAALNFLQRSALTKPNSSYAYIAPTYRMAKSVAWGLLKDASRFVVGVKQMESELMVIYPNGSRITLYGAENPDRLRGIGLHGVVFDEYGMQPTNIFSEVIRPTLSENLGYAIWIGTPKGKNEFFRLYDKHREDEEWFVRHLTVDDTNIISREEIESSKKTMSKEEETITTAQSPEEPLEVTVQPEKIEIEIDPEIIKICADVSNLSSSEDDIVEDLIELCDLVSNRNFDDEGELKSIEAKVENKWEIWEEVKRNNESAELERKLNETEEDLAKSSDPEPEPIQEQTDTEPDEEQVVEGETESVDDPYSDYNFSYTYSYHHPDPEWIKRFNISQTSRDLRITKAIFEITDEDAEKYDSITDPSSPPRVWFCKQQCSSYTLERTSNNTFSYVGSKNSGIKISEGYLYVDLPIPAFPEGMITNISLPVSDWKIWDNTTDKQVKTW